MDRITKQQRNYIMSRIKSRNTKIEIVFRKILWNNKLRGYRLKSRLKANPDIYFPKSKLAVFIDGCFWHKCPKCFRQPQSNIAYWDQKIERNVVRDKRNNKELKKLGIKTLRLWGHEIREDIVSCLDRLKRSL